MRTALVTDWLVGYRGSERVLEQMLALHPHGDLYATLEHLQPGERGWLGGRTARTSFLQSFPWAATKHRLYLPLMPLAVEQFDLSQYDLILSSSHAVAKGVLRGPDQLHISYVHSPLRYAWDLQHQYLQQSGLLRGPRSWLARGILHYVRQWDVASANRVDVFVANSRFIARRIHNCYRRRARVIHPPVDVESCVFSADREDFYLTASRIVPYKRIDLIVDAFKQMPNRQLVVIGDGPGLAAIRRRAGANVRVLGYQSKEVLQDYMRRARSFVLAAEEDFGIAPVEAQACGTPVIAFGKGGALETVVEGKTGILFAQQTVSSLVSAVEQMESQHLQFDPYAARKNAERFSVARFCWAFSGLVDRSWERFERRRRGLESKPKAGHPDKV